MVTKREYNKVTTLIFAFRLGTQQETIEKLGRRFTNQEGVTMEKWDDEYVVGPFLTARSRRRARGILNEYMQVDHETIGLIYNENFQRVHEAIDHVRQPHE